MGRQVIIARGLVEVCYFLTQLIWVYVLQSFGAIKTKKLRVVDTNDNNQVEAADVERLSMFEGDDTTTLMFESSRVL